MRDAFGGVFTIQILLVFIIIFVGFIAISLNYSRAFRIKNYVIDMIEERELSDLSDPDFRDTVKDTTMSFGYANESVCEHVSDDVNTTCINGIIVKRINSSLLHGTNHYYYAVNVPVIYNFGFLTSLLSLTNGGVSDTSVPSGVWAVSGETRVVVRDN